MYAFVQAHRHEYEVEQIHCALQIAPPHYYAAKQAERDPLRLSPHRHRDAVFRDKIQSTYAAHLRVYDLRNMWQKLRHDGAALVHCTRVWLMGVKKIQGVMRGARMRTSRPAEDRLAHATDLMRRQFSLVRPNQA
jgi:putative transposase